MPKTIPTEEDLGIDMTPEEQDIASRPIVSPIDDADDEGEDLQVAVVKDADERPAPRKTRERDPETGKFLNKDDADPQARPDARPQAGMTDIRALQEERALRRQTEERMQILLDTMQKREAREAKAAEPAAPAIPDKTTDPLGYMEYMDQRLGKFEAETAQQTQARQAAESEQAEMQQVLAVAVPEYQQATAADPELEPMRAGLMESYAKEICYLNGVPMDGRATPQQRQFVQAELTKIENSHIKFAVTSRRPLGEYIKGLAATRGIVAQAQQSPVQSQPNGQRSISDRQAAQSRHQSIGDLPGNAAPSKINAKDVAKMSNDEFAAFAGKMSDKELDALFLKA